MQFPRKEGDIVVLANEMKIGFASSEDIFPAPPIAPIAMTELIAAVNSAQGSVDAAKAALEAAVASKVLAFEEIISAMKKNIRYAELTVGPGEENNLTKIGWGPKKEPTPLEAPGPAQFLTANPQGEGWLLLEWQKPLEGGKPVAYMVMRRKRGDGAWDNVGTSTECSIELSNQERKVEWEYCIIATNKAGDALESNIVMAVL